MIRLQFKERVIWLNPNHIVSVVITFDKSEGELLIITSNSNKHLVDNSAYNIHSLGLN